MPRLKQITCSVDWAETSAPFSEYGTAYGDGVVETYIAVPAKPQLFTIHLKSHGYIAEGIATLIYVDGEYQCNRNRVNLKPFKRDQSKAETEVDFRLRQKEKTIGDGQFLGRDWRFDCHNVVPADQAPSDFDAAHFDQLGTIEVIVLRCRARGLQVDDDATDSYTHDSVLSKMRESGQEERPDEASAANRNQESHRPTVEEAADGGGLFGIFGVDGAADEPDASQRHHFGVDGEAPLNGYWTWTYQPPASPSYFQPPQKRVHFDMGPPQQSADSHPPLAQQQPPLARFDHPPQNQAGWSNPQQQQLQPQAQVFYPPQGQAAWQAQQSGPPQLSQGAPVWGGPTPTQRNISNESANTIPSSYFSQPQMQNQLPPQMQPQKSQQYVASQMPGQWAPPPLPSVSQSPRQAQGWPPQGYGGGGNWSAYAPWPGPSPYGYSPSVVPNPAMPRGSFVTQMQRPPAWQAQGLRSGWNMITSPTGPPQPPGGWAGGPGPQQNRGGGPALDPNQPVGLWGATNSPGGNWNAGDNQGGGNWSGDCQQNNSGNGGWSGGDQNTPQQDQPNNNIERGGGDTTWGANQNDQTPQSNDNWGGNDNNNQTQQSDAAWGADQNNNTRQNNDTWPSSNDDNNNNNNNNNAQTTQWGGAGTYDAAGPATSGTRSSRPLYGPHGAYYTTVPRSATLDSEAEAEEDPPYDVPETVATEKATTHQVQPGKGYLYTHRRASPEYLDNIEEPYARFVFKYRTKGESNEIASGERCPICAWWGRRPVCYSSKCSETLLHDCGTPSGCSWGDAYWDVKADDIVNAEQIEREIGISLPGEPTGDKEKQEYQSKSQNELIELLLRAKIALGGKIPSPPPAPLGVEEQPEANILVAKPVLAPKHDYLKYQLPESRKSSGNTGVGPGIAAPANDGWGNAGGGQTDNNSNKSGGGWGDNNNQQSGQNWDSGASGWDGPKNDTATNLANSQQEQQPQSGDATRGRESQTSPPPLAQAGGWENLPVRPQAPAPPGGWTSGAAPNAGQVEHGGSGTWSQPPPTQMQARPQTNGWGTNSGPDESPPKTADGWQSSQQQQSQNVGGNTGGGGGWEAAAPAGGAGRW